MFMISERIHEKRRGGGHHEHVEQFNQTTGRARSARRHWASTSPTASWWRSVRTQQPLHAGKDAGGDRSGDHRRGRDDGQGGASRGDIAGGGPELDDYARN